MYPGQLGGSIGPFRDPNSGQSVNGSVNGSFTFAGAGDPAAMAPRAQAALLRAITNVIAQKLAANQVAIPTIAGSVPYFSGEIVAAAAAEVPDIQLSALQLTVDVQNPYAAMPGVGGPLPPIRSRRPRTPSRRPRKTGWTHATTTMKRSSTSAGSRSRPAPTAGSTPKA